ncbi:MULTISPECIES: arylsulfatase [unclassified Carboxylicivirga]|uniref:arylsulfatase n=1 Tax=Carboxylicivirga TaxID=1628153 RepID=UPI003D34C1C4
MLLKRFVILGVAALSMMACTETPKDQSPHILLIMADDMGFSDLGCYGSEIPTPNLDALADQGVRFSQFKNTSRCCPSRAALLTGRHQHSVEMGWMTAVDEHRPGYRGQLSSTVPTIAELFRENDYHTYMSGKWHVSLDGSWEDPESEPNGSWPTERGFERYYGSLAGGGSYYTPKGLMLQDKRITTVPEDYYYTTAITKNAVQFIEEHPSDKSMFMYLAHYAPHRPLQAPAAMVEAHREKYRVGYDKLKEARYIGLIREGLVPEGYDLPLHHTEYGGKRPAWDELDDATKERWVTEMATFSAMIEIMDEGIGQVINTLKEKGMYDNTIILFLSDNGATNEGGFVSQLAADLSNTPYRSYKGFTHLGGVSSPLIIHYPKKYKALNGSILNDVAHITDLLPTCIDMANISYPNTFNGQPLSPPHGRSLAGLLEGGQRKAQDQFFEHRGNCAILSGKWRMVKLAREEQWQLYQLEHDPFEQHDVAADYPEKVQELQVKWMTWAQNNKVLPLESKPWTPRINYYKNLNPDQDGID